MAEFDWHAYTDRWWKLAEANGEKPVHHWRSMDGTEGVKEYDPHSLCLGCGLPIVMSSTSGTGICPWCDSGHDRNGREFDYLQYCANLRRSVRAHGWNGPAGWHAVRRLTNATDQELQGAEFDAELDRLTDAEEDLWQ